MQPPVVNLEQALVESWVKAINREQRRVKFMLGQPLAIAPRIERDLQAVNEQLQAVVDGINQAMAKARLP